MPGSKWRPPRSARSAWTPPASACSASTNALACREQITCYAPCNPSAEAFERGIGGGEAGEIGAVRGREEIGRARLAGKEQAILDRGGEHGAVAGMAGQGIRIGAARPPILPPGRRRERRDPPADIGAEQARQLVGGEGGHAGFALFFERRRPAPAEKAGNDRPSERADLIARGLAPPCRADQMDVVADPGPGPGEGQKQFVGESERQAGSRRQLVGKRRIEGETLLGEDRGRYR